MNNSWQACYKKDMPNLGRNGSVLRCRSCASVLTRLTPQPQRTTMPISAYMESLTGFGDGVHPYLFTLSNAPVVHLYFQLR